MDALLVKEYRAGIVESTHYGHICIVNDQGEVYASAGDPHFVTFTRSAAKPLQAIPGIRAGIADYYGLTEEEIAIMAASHLAEPRHIEVLESIQRKIGVDEEQMVCAPTYPLSEDSKEHTIREQGRKRRLYHNCSGKHLGVLGYSRMRHNPEETYAEPDHPAQREILDVIATMSGMEAERIGLGTDGCGFPVFALPLSAMANAYVKLACPDLIPDEPTRTAVRTITAAMNHYPAMVGGTRRVDTFILQDPNIVAKGGFKGVYCFGLKKERLGIALKILDGSEEEWGWVVESILQQIGYDNRRLLEGLRSEFTKDIYNDAGRKVGHAETVFTLERSR
ncbi:asparaginase [Paenibacillus sp. Y412MC10]|uniref:asparaginase n=1 Tax=Geobacillus sp. (strain Y412MC10) TaxID=481743 RepID=UPI00119CDCF0|nr:asparaginase [Paenibacillus sp. Y412MC10]